MQISSEQIPASMHLESIGTFVPTVADSLREKKCKSTMLLQLTLHEERDCIVFWRHHWKKEESTDWIIFVPPVRSATTKNLILADGGFSRDT